MFHLPEIMFSMCSPRLVFTILMFFCMVLVHPSSVIEISRFLCVFKPKTIEFVYKCLYVPSPGDHVFYVFTKVGFHYFNVFLYGFGSPFKRYRDKPFSMCF